MTEYRIISSELGLVGDDELGPLGPFDPARDYLVPAAAASVTITIVLADQSGRPAPGVTVNASCRPETLTGVEWRTVDGLVRRWPANSATKLRERIQQGLIRLSGKLDKTSTSTDTDGRASFTIGAWHVCGNESLCGSDRLSLSWRGGSTDVVLRCGMPNMQAVPNEPGNGMIVTGNGYFVQSGLIGTLRAIGQAWRDTPGKPTGMPSHYVITDGSLRWGGLTPPHMTHRFGGAIDARPISTDGQPTNVGATNYSREGTQILIDYLHQTGASEIRFADPLPHVTVVDASHSNHLHASWLQSPTEPWFVPVARVSILSATMK